MNEGNFDNGDITNDELAFLDGVYTIYFEGDEISAYIDVENEEISIGSWYEEGEEAINAIREIYQFYRHSKGTIESAIEGYAYDLSR